MKHIYLIQLLLLYCICAYSQPTPNGRPLRVIMLEKFPDKSFILGGTTGQSAFGTETGKIMDREFSYVTPENDFKQPQIHPDNSSKFDWSRPDAWLKHIVENDQILRMHGPISPQCSKWTKDDSRTGEELKKNLEDFMIALCKRYNGKPGVEYMDVVNETIINGGWFGPKDGTDKWENPWTKIGFDTDKNKTPLYIKMAFEITTQHAPDIKLIYNQHEKALNKASWDKIKETVLYLRQKGLRVDGIGWQAHINAEWEKINGQTEMLNELIEWSHGNNLEFHITENSVFIADNSSSELKKQKETYETLVKILALNAHKGKVGYNTWHIDDGHGSNKDKLPSLFDEKCEAKPAYYGIQNFLEVFKQLGKTEIPKRHTIYPNPAINTINIDVESVSLISIYDVSGKEVYSTQGIAIKTINIQRLKNGLYLLSAETIDNIMFRSRFVKN